MQNEIIRVGLVGAGANTRLRHITGLRQQEGVENDSPLQGSRKVPKPLVDMAAQAWGAACLPPRAARPPGG